MTSFQSRETFATTHTHEKAGHRFAFLDALRGLAALAVILHHAGQTLSMSYRTFALSTFDLGNFGVMLFFLCSGFIIPSALERQASLRGFWIRRFFRLYPLYWVCIGLALILGYRSAWSGYPASFFAHPIAFVLANMTTFPTSLGFTNMMSTTWTLMFEVAFYGIISLQFRMGLIKYAVLMAVGILLSAVLVEGILPLTIGVQLPNGIISFYGTMFVGAVLYRYSIGEIRLVTLQRVLALALTTEVVTLIGDMRLEPIWTHWIVARLLAYIVFIAALAFRKRFPAHLLCRLGMISYSLYLVHPFVLALIPVQQSPLLTMGLWLGVIFLVASLTYRVIEQPAIAFGSWLSSVVVSPTLEIGATARVRIATFTPAMPMLPISLPAVEPEQLMVISGVRE